MSRIIWAFRGLKAQLCFHIEFENFNPLYSARITFQTPLRNFKLIKLPKNLILFNIIYHFCLCRYKSTSVATNLDIKKNNRYKMDAKNKNVDYSYKDCIYYCERRNPLLP